jgi:hypothetical protein
MRKEKEHDEPIDPSQPSLIVVYGATKRKQRPLLGDVVVVGRSPSCDIGLVSPEVAPVHCILVRMTDGWHIRDCSNRATRINGRSVQEGRLKDGDVIQVGAFSFEARLPAVDLTPEPPLLPGQLEHILESRRRFAERALRFRTQLRDQERAFADLAQREADLEQMEHRLRTLHREAQAKLARRAEGTATAPESDTPRPTSSELDARAEELEQYSQHLNKQERRLREREAELTREIEADRAGFEADLTRQRVELENERREIIEMREAIQHRQADLEEMAGQLEEVLLHEREQLEREREQIVHEKEYLEVQHQEVIRLRIELERLRAEAAGPPRPEGLSTRDTWLDSHPDDRLEAARRLLRELAERRKANLARANAGDPGGQTPAP